MNEDAEEVRLCRELGHCKLCVEDELVTIQEFSFGSRRSQTVPSHITRIKSCDICAFCKGYFKCDPSPSTECSPWRSSLRKKRPQSVCISSELHESMSIMIISIQRLCTVHVSGQEWVAEISLLKRTWHEDLLVIIQLQFVVFHPDLLWFMLVLILTDYHKYSSFLKTMFAWRCFASLYIHFNLSFGMVRMRQPSKSARSLLIKSKGDSC